MEVFTLRVCAVGIVGGSVGAAVYFETPAVALFGLVALWPALSAHWLSDLASRTAEHLPPKPTAPARTGSGACGGGLPAAKSSRPPGRRRGAASRLTACRMR